MKKVSNFIYRLNKFIKENLVKNVFGQNSKNIFQQIYEVIYLAYKTKYFPHNYYKFNGYLKGVDVKNILDYIPGTLFDSIRDDLLNDPRYIVLIEDKLLFSNFLASNNLQGTECFGLYLPSAGFVDKNYTKVNQEQFLNNLTSDFVIKPVSESAQGDGVKVISLSEVKNKQEFLNYLKENIKFESLIEKKIIQNEKISFIYPDSVNTIRIDTLKKVSGEIMIGHAVLRVGRNGRKIDNWSGEQGGIIIPIDLNTGKLKDVGFDYFFKKYNKHPNTEVIFKNYEMPYFEEIVELVKRAALVFPKTKSLGWDVAITQNGPMIIEANHDYTMQLMQEDKPFFKNIPFAEAIKEYVYSSDKGKKYRKYFDN